MIQKSKSLYSSFFNNSSSNQGTYKYRHGKLTTIERIRNFIEIDKMQMKKEVTTVHRLINGKMKLVMQKKVFVTVITLILFVPALTQLTIKNIAYRNKEGSINLEFPVIRYFDKKIEHTINKCIQNRILELDSTNQYKSGPPMFNKTIYNENEGLGGFISLSYAAYCTKRILSIRFKGETIGVYPGNYADNFTFNLKNGKLLQIDDLIERNTTFNIYDTLYNLNKQEMKNTIIGIDSDIVGHVRAVLEESINEKKAIDFYISNDSIVFFHSPAGFSRAMRCYEMNLNTSFSIQDLGTHFTETGKLILINDTDTHKKKDLNKHQTINSSNWYY